MKKTLLVISLFYMILISCERNCHCELAVYESTFQNNYEWTEIDREPFNGCEQDPMSSTFLDIDGNISYITSIVECEN